jgi:hypothetical protein
MGGGREIVEATRQYSELSDELGEVTFIFLPIVGNFEFFDTYKVSSNIEKEILDFYEDLGIKCKSWGYAGGGGGGGGLENLIEIFRIFYQSLDVILLIGSIIRVVKQYIVLSHHRKIQNSKPRFSIAFKIHSESMIDKIVEKEAGKILENKLSNFLLLTQSLINKLAANYTFIKFDVSIEASLGYPNYILNLNIPDDLRNSNLISRYLSIISGSIKVRNNFRSGYIPSRWRAIKRTDSMLMDSSEQVITEKTYYLFLSSKVLKDYF